VQRFGLAELNAKRAFGLLSYHARRKRRYLPAIAARVLEDLAAYAPDHVAVTGDLTHMGLRAEVAEAASWLARIGPPERVTFVPGNHDAYGATHDHAVMDEWRPYLDSDAPRAPELGVSPFPIVRVRGGVALVGLSSAVPTGLHLATGRVGAAQLAPLADLLSDHGARGHCRVVLVHHPPTRAHVSWRRRLEDGPALCEILARAGAELVLHGHAHRAARDAIASACGAIPVLGVPATSSAVGARPGAYQVLAIEQRAGGRYAIARELREVTSESAPIRSGGVEAIC
jgi:3',5'-cyclic AMP phosphodiesterase CpdA